MTKYVDRVHTQRDGIDHLEALIPQLPTEARVALTLNDGSKLQGVVAVRPTLQTFRDASEQEGVNALLRLDDLNDPARQHHVWLDQIHTITQLGGV